MITCSIWKDRLGDLKIWCEHIFTSNVPMSLEQRRRLVNHVIQIDVLGSRNLTLA